jgi:hypothetical protein
LRNATVFTLQGDVGEIDLLAEVTGLGTFDDVKRHSMTVDAFERQIATLDLPGLIRAKRATGRDKDLSALAELEPPRTWNFINIKASHTTPSSSFQEMGSFFQKSKSKLRRAPNPPFHARSLPNQTR